MRRQRGTSCNEGLHVSRRNDQTTEALRELESLLRRLDAALVVRDPGNARSVDAYDGLRRQVASAMRERRAHLSQLVQFADALDRGANLNTLASLVEEWLLQAGLTRWMDSHPVDFFRIDDESVTETDAHIEVTVPAWVDASDPESPVLVRQGTAVLRRRSELDNALPDDIVDGPMPMPTPVEADEPAGSADEKPENER